MSGGGERELEKDSEDLATPACPRAAPETTPLWRLFLIKLSLSQALDLRRGYEASLSPEPRNHRSPRGAFTLLGPDSIYQISFLFLVALVTKLQPGPGAPLRG